MPHSGQIFADSQDGLAILSGEFALVCLSPSLIFLFNALDGAQLLLPRLFKATGDEPIFRFLCGVPHKNRYVAAPVMWRPVIFPRNSR